MATRLDVARIPAPFAEPPRPGSGALLPTLGQRVVRVTEDREVGFGFSPESCGESGTLDGTGCATSGEKEIPDNRDEIEAWSFAIWAGDKCSPWELGRDWRGRAVRQLDASESFQAAHELWTGTEAKAMTNAPNQFLNSADSDVLTAGPTSPTDALAVLEQGLGECAHGARGVIHATRHAATFWAQLGLLRREGGQILTYLDTIVIADAGYDGSGPANGDFPDGVPAADGSQWAYATGLPIVRLGPVFTIPDADDTGAALNRGTNTVEWRAERKAAVGWDGCCHLAAEIQLGWLDLGGS